MSRSVARRAGGAMAAAIVAAALTLRSVFYALHRGRCGHRFTGLFDGRRYPCNLPAGHESGTLAPWHMLATRREVRAVIRGEYLPLPPRGGNVHRDAFTRGRFRASVHGPGAVAYAAGYLFELAAGRARRARRPVETAVCAALIVATVAGVTGATVAEYGTAAGSPGQLAPAAATVDSEHPRRDALRWLAAHVPACAYEDSRNCYWDARTSGNGRGESFVDIRGRAFYFRPAPLGGAS